MTDYDEMMIETEPHNQIELAAGTIIVTVKVILI